MISLTITPDVSAKEHMSADGTDHPVGTIYVWLSWDEDGKSFNEQFAVVPESFGGAYVSRLEVRAGELVPVRAKVTPDGLLLEWITVLPGEVVGSVMAVERFALIECQSQYQWDAGRTPNNGTFWLDRDGVPHFQLQADPMKAGAKLALAGTFEAR